jgi:hypothetical protein
MEKHWLVEKGIKSQKALAEILGNGDLCPRLTVRAHRIWHGAIPNDNDIKVIYSATKGAVSANDFYGLNPKPTKKRNNPT